MLYIGGFFFEDAGPPVQGLLRWDGTGWMEPGLAPPTGNAVYELASYGGDLFAAGAFMRIGEEQADGIARFDGTDWTTPLGPDQGIRPVRFWPLMPAVRDGRSVLVVGGWFMIDQGDDVIANRLAVWDGNMWTSLTPEPTVDVRDPASLIEFDDGLGEAVFVAGNNVAGSASVSRLRDGVLLPMPDPGFDVAVELFVFDDGSGPVLLVGGQADRDVIPPAFLVRWQPAAPCPADINSDCQLDLFDFLAFQDAFDDGDPRADIDGDGRLSVFDFLAFQNAFDAGCG
ncbi:MAG: hypothetical protein HRU13_13785 [Phycisphaerales bacterium]|nr:hypothetical protein [Phycisphaerales bacterium]